MMRCAVKKWTSRSLRALFITSIRFLRKKSGLWLRALLCLGIGMGSLWLTWREPFDLRLQIRGPQPVSSQILIIEGSRQDWLELTQKHQSLIRAIKESTKESDVIYWNPKVWSHLLKRALQGNPRKIGIDFFFGEATHHSSLKKWPIFKNPKIVWSTLLDSENQVHPLYFKKNSIQNVGLNYFRTDKNGVLRSFISPSLEVPHFSLKMIESPEWSLAPLLLKYTTPHWINFQGPPGTYKRISLNEFLSKDFPLHSLKNKFIIFGAKEEHLFHTPTGLLSEAEVNATLIDSFINHKWIKKVPLELNLLLLFLLLLICIQIMSYYPQSISFVAFLWIGITLSVISIWLFDKHYIWLPLEPPLFQLAVTFIVFLSFQLTVSDYEKWQLENEKRVLLEVEQLKNNFISLFSHDLKNPIAKIQAICDRLLTLNPSQDIQEGLLSLRKESSELHRYIQKILQISRVESRDFKIIKNSEDLNEIIKRSVQQLLPLIKEKHIHFEVQLEPLFLIEVDKNLIYEVILNLLDNAIKYTPKGGHILIESKDLGKHILFSVQDSGPGIPEEEKKLVFEKFYRLKKDQDYVKGSGLGLYLVKYFIELHGGKVFLESQPNKGTKIGFFLPVEEGANSD
ncbi:MAG: CHASE2 domain-containing protein [Bdellovibrio sp.]|nr:MAG: CHASE2 domain-containing protein [Bdellovibrio sp.]